MSFLKKKKPELMRSDLRRQLEDVTRERDQLRIDLELAESRYKDAQRCSEEYLHRAERAEKKYEELEKHLNEMYEEYASFRDRLKRRGD